MTDFRNQQWFTELDEDDQDNTSDIHAEAVAARGKQSEFYSTSLQYPQLVDAHLNAITAAGWELVNIVVMRPERAEGTIAIFKRQKPFGISSVTAGDLSTPVSPSAVIGPRGNIPTHLVATATSGERRPELTPDDSDDATRDSDTSFIATDHTGRVGPSFVIGSRGSSHKSNPVTED